MSASRIIYKQYSNAQSDGPEVGIYIKYDADIFTQYVMLHLNSGVIMFFQMNMPATYPYSPPKINNITPYYVTKHENMPVNSLVKHELLGTNWHPAMDLVRTMLYISVMANEIEFDDVSINNTLEKAVFPVLGNCPGDWIVKMFSNDIKQLWAAKRDMYMSYLITENPKTKVLNYLS